MENLTEEATDKPLGDMIRKAVPDFLTETTLEDIVDVFPVTAGGKLTIDADCGEIDVQSTEDDNLSVRIQRAAQIKANRRAAEILKNLDVQITHEASDVKIEAKFIGNAKRWRKRRNDLDVQFDILVPRHYNLDLKTACDDISIMNVTGDVNVETFRAGLRLQGITGRIDGDTSIGNIDLKAFNGMLSFGRPVGTLRLRMAMVMSKPRPPQETYKLHTSRVPLTEKPLAVILPYVAAKVGQT